MKKEYFKISEAAKLTNVTRQTLIFYDKNNILKPAYVDETNGYRYYTEPQLNIIQIINMLKEFGTPLKVIEEYLHNRDGSELLKLLYDIRGQMVDRIKITNNYLNTIDYKIKQINNSLNIDNFDEIRLELLEPMAVLVGQKLEHEDQTPQGHFEKVHDFKMHLMSLGIVETNFNVIVEKAYLKKDYDNYISYFCIDMNSNHEHAVKKTLPGGLYAYTFHKGSNQSSSQSYIRLINYINNNENLEIQGDAYEINIANYLTAEENIDYISKIYIKVKEI